MIVTTTSVVEYQVRDYLGIVTGEAILGASGSILMVSTSGTAVVVA